MPTVTMDEYIEIGGVPLATPAWLALDFASLWDGPDVRGSDQLIPYRPGVRARRRRRTVTVRNVTLCVFGDYDSDGTPQSDTRAGLWENVAYLRENVIDPLDTGDGTRTLTLYLPDGSSVSTPCHVIPPCNWQAVGPTALQGVLSLSMPAGGLLLPAGS